VVTTVPANLNCHSSDEVNDLIIWLDDHPEPGDFDGDATENELLYGHITRRAAQDWLVAIFEMRSSYPTSFPVPNAIVKVIEAVIADWCEVVFAHRDEFLTKLDRAA
jgi:hypothetical protein